MIFLKRPVENSDIERLQRTAAADLWRNTLSQIPSVFGKLVYLSSLRSPITGKYEHHGLALVFGEDEAARALRKSHTHAFAEWLSFNLEQQKADLDLYLSAVLEDKRAVVETWLSVRTYRTFIPSSAKTVEKRLYLADIEALIALLKNEHGVAGPDRDA
jgi:hypothetical protein